MSRHLWYRCAAPLVLAASLCIPAAAAAQGVPQPHVPVSTTLGDIAAFRSAYVDAFNAKDAKATSAMYTADAILLDANGNQTIGMRSIAKLFADSAANWPHAVANSNSVKVYGNTAVDVGTWTVHPMTGGEVVMRYLAVLRHGVNGWKAQSVALVPVPK